MNMLPDAGRDRIKLPRAPVIRVISNIQGGVTGGNAPQLHSPRTESTESTFCGKEIDFTHSILDAPAKQFRRAK